MSNIGDYLDWRGDLKFEFAPFNEVDNLILSMITYINYDGIIPDENKGLYLYECAEEIFNLDKDERTVVSNKIMNSEEIVLLFKKASCRKRFKSIKLSDYVNEIDEEEEKQFSALTYTLGDGTKYISFRGTDDTIIGWKENFNMAFLSSVPSQADAVSYLKRIALKGWEPIRVGGHSKGGNLAVYAAAKSLTETQARIIQIYNNDGPGFQNGLLEENGYKNIKSKIKTIIPASSIIGVLLEHEENYKVVKSTQTGLYQHSGLRWEVLGDSFVCLDQVTQGSRYVDKTLKSWINNMKEKQREELIETIFTILESTEAKTIAELGKDRFKKIKMIIRTFRELDKETKDMLTKTFKLLFSEGKSILNEIKKSSELKT